MINIFVCTCPNRSGVGAIDKPDRFEQAFDQYFIPEDPEKNIKIVSLGQGVTELSKYDGRICIRWVK